MTKKAKTVKAMRAAFDNLMAMAEESKDDREVISDSFNAMLDDLLRDDFFGTEGQLDPRGDRRND